MIKFFTCKSIIVDAGEGETSKMIEFHSIVTSFNSQFKNPDDAIAKVYGIDQAKADQILNDYPTAEEITAEEFATLQPSYDA